ncbi:ABC transporter permease [Oscillibacter ruminantium]|uniref:ABC transporter permease n=1 Tax=Oscillibacter ruminantium TaxID=1263547 RepID=UPI000303AD64|nr:ABC transporter permease [Oscillibacter ruminantium]MDN0033624.1 ABC transporter permease [Oscillibacter valericigenes]
MSEKNRRPHRHLAYKTISILSFCVIIALWCLLTYGGMVTELFVPSPTKVLSTTVDMARDGSLWINCWMSVKRVMVGWFWSAVAALPIGMVMARSKAFSAVIQPIIEFARYLPVVALVPLTILYLGIDETQKYVIIWLGTFFQLVLMVCDTVGSVDKNMINAARTLGANRWQVYKEVIFPAALPGLMDDFRLTIGWAWTYLVVAEMVAASNGLGYIILKSQRFLATDVIFSGLITIGIIGLLTDFAVKILTRAIVPWHERLGE